MLSWLNCLTSLIWNQKKQIERRFYWQFTWHLCFHLGNSNKNNRVSKINALDFLFTGKGKSNETALAPLYSELLLWLTNLFFLLLLLPLCVSDSLRSDPVSLLLSLPSRSRACHNGWNCLDAKACSPYSFFRPYQRTWLFYKAQQPPQQSLTPLALPKFLKKRTTNSPTPDQPQISSLSMASTVETIDTMDSNAEPAAASSSSAILTMA